MTALRKKQDIEGGLDAEKQALQQKTMRNMLMLEKQLSDDKKELEECRNMISEDASARIKVSRTANIGTKVMFGDQYIFLREKYDFCQFIKKDGDIKSSGM